MITLPDSLVDQYLTAGRPRDPAGDGNLRLLREGEIVANSEHRHRRSTITAATASPLAYGSLRSGGGNPTDGNEL